MTGRKSISVVVRYKDRDGSLSRRFGRLGDADVRGDFLVLVSAAKKAEVSETWIPIANIESVRIWRPPTPTPTK